MSFSLFPLFVLFVVWALVSSLKKGKTGGQSAKKTPGSAPGKQQPTKAAFTGSGMDARFRKEFPGLFAQPEGEGSLPVSTPEGTDPCHDDLRRMPSGSLRADSPEGTDPCHDDPYGMPSGSLQAESTEGTDPCHDDWKPARARTEDSGRQQNAETAGGLDLKWTGNEIVRGFVYGEILKRKTGA